MATTLAQAAERSGTEEAGFVTGEICREDERMGPLCTEIITLSIESGDVCDDRFSTMRKTHWIAVRSESFGQYDWSVVRKN